MSDLAWEKRDARGEWTPDPLPEPGPLFQWPLRPIKIAKYLFAPEGFLWPFNLFYALLAICVWYFFTPGPDRTATFAFGWIAGIYLRNVVLLVIIVGGLHLRLYISKGQGTKFKYTSKWLEVKNKKFLFGNQTADNVFWNLTSGAMIWTAWEAVSLWMFANDKIPYISFRSSPVYFVLLMIAVIFIRMIHFYWIHRLIHWKPLYKACHYLHHKYFTVNFGHESVPLDKWFGIFHDGSEEAHKAMLAKRGI